MTIKHLYTTEKAMDAMDFENKLLFMVELDATKNEIETAVEDRYDVEVADVNTMITMNGTKKATVELTADYEADDIAARTGVF